jgi:hypothetical protein
VAEIGPVTLIVKLLVDPAAAVNGIFAPLAGSAFPALSAMVT